MPRCLRLCFGIASCILAGEFLSLGHPSRVVFQRLYTPQVFVKGSMLLSNLVRLPLLAFCVFAGAAHVTADQLQHYIESTGAPQHITVTEKGSLGPIRISFQSQVWRDIPWQHELLLQNPETNKHPEYVAIVLTGGQGGDEQRRSAKVISDELGIRAAVLTQVPNQPLFGGRKEDDLLSFTLDHYRRSGDASWPLLFPMVTSVVRAIDVLEETLERKDLKVILVGASKRGWTTYLSAAMDKRIPIIIPAVFEMISMSDQLALARARYGQDSEKIRAYTTLGLTSSLDDTRVQDLITWLDPITYASKLTAAKLIILGSNDPYWVADSARYYWDRLPEPKALRTVANIGHGALQDPTAIRSILPFAKRLINNKPLPIVTWAFSESSNPGVRVSGTSNETLTNCVVWRAESTDTDVRDDTFVQGPCTISNDGKSFSAAVKTNPAHTIAFFAQLELAAPEGQDKFVLSTETRVITPPALVPLVGRVTQSDPAPTPKK